MLLHSPPVAAILADTHGRVFDLIAGFAGSRTAPLIFFLFERGSKKPKYQPGYKKRKPQEKIYDPPPRSDKYPPEDTVALLLVF